MSDRPATKCPSYDALLAAGIDVTEHGGVIAIRIPGMVLGCSIGSLIGASMLGSVVFLIAWAFGATMSIRLVAAVATTLTLAAALIWLAYRFGRSYPVIVDYVERTVRIPEHTSPPKTMSALVWSEVETKFAWSKVVHIGVGWGKWSGQPPAPDTPAYICFRLGPGHVVSLNPRLKSEQFRVLVQWLHGELFPDAVLGSLDPDSYAQSVGVEHRTHATGFPPSRE